MAAGESTQTLKVREPQPVPKAAVQNHCGLLVRTTGGAWIPVSRVTCTNEVGASDHSSMAISGNNVMVRAPSCVKIDSVDSEIAYDWS